VDGVNKVIIEKNKFRVDGNTVLAPYEPLKKHKYEDLEESRKRVNQNKKQKDIKKKKGVIINIFLILVIGIIIVARYSMIYHYQDASTKAIASIDALTKENDAYEVELIKFRNISYVEKTATEKLHMVKPRISEIEYLDLSKNNLETSGNSGVRVKSDVVNIIKNIIF